MAKIANVSSTHKLLIPGILGSILEWYDFALYGFLAPVIAQQFFPTHSEFLSLLATFGVFAAGFLMRPLGAILFGHFGDRIGRKKTLATAIILMALPTTLIGLLPTHAQIGASAGILLTVCRLLQGLAMSGDLSGSIIYVTEHAPSHRRGFWASWLVSASFIGLLLGSAASALMSNLLSVAAFNNWGWRIPFLAGSSLGIIGFYLRLRMPETPAFLAIQAARTIVKNPFNFALKNAWISMSIIMGLNFLPAVAFYLLFVYFTSYVTNYLHFPPNVGFTINTISMLALIFLIPSGGWLSDKIGRKPVFFLGALGFVLFSYPLFLLLQQGSVILLLLVQLCFALFTCFIFAPIPSTFAELMTTHIRYTGISFAQNLGSAIYGGTTPLVVTYLIHVSNNYLAPSLYLIFGGIVTLITLTMKFPTAELKLSPPHLTPSDSERIDS